MMRCMQNTDKSAQLGQSTLEMLVLSSVLVPLMLIVPLLGKFLDISETAAEASRYMAMEATVHNTAALNGWKSDTVLAQEVRRRLFSNPDAPIKTSDVAGDFDAHRNQLWFDYAGNSLLPDYDSNVSVKSKKEDFDQPFGAIYSGAFGLSKNNLYTGEVAVNIANVPGLQEFSSQTKSLSVNRRMVILVDPWAASGPTQVANRVNNQSIYPYQLSGLELVGEAMDPVIGVFEFNASPPKIGRVDPDWVPKDRVKDIYVK